MTIRPLKTSDLPALARLYRQFWGETSCLKRMTSAFERLAENPDYIFLAADAGDGIAGAVTGIVCHELYGQCRPFMVVEDVIVDRDHRRRGIASDLMRTVERTAIARGCSHIIFVTEAGRTDAHRFYQSLGYRADTHKGFKKRLEPPHPETPVDA
jgi:GNAT superfamily N-acetyltransferase